MRIVCPSCSAAYEVPDALLGGAANPRKLRCAKCQLEWVPPELAAPPPMPIPHMGVAMAEVEAVLPPIPDPPPPRFAEPGLGDVPPRSVRISASGGGPRAADLVAVMVSLVVLVGLGWGAYTHRATIMAAWPPSQRIFLLLGLSS